MDFASVNTLSNTTIFSSIHKIGEAVYTVYHDKIKELIL